MPQLSNQQSIFNSQQSTSLDFVDECTIESDYQMYFPEYFVPGSAERMLLYRELEHLQTEQDIDNYTKRLTDRFGKLPREAEELLRVVPLRQLGKHFGCEKIILKNRQMRMQFIANDNSPFYNSTAFTLLLGYLAANPRRCQLQPTGKRMLIIDNVSSVKEAVEVLQTIAKGE